MARDAIYVDFFNPPRGDHRLGATVALRTGAPVDPWSRRRWRGCYRRVTRAQSVPPASHSADAVQDFTQRCTDVLEMYVRRNPGCGCGCPGGGGTIATLADENSFQRLMERCN